MALPADARLEPVMPEHKLMGGYSRSLDRYYELYAAVEPDGRVCLREHYEYPDRAGIEGREYDHRLWIAEEHLDALLVWLAREARLEPALPPAEQKEAYLVALLARLIKQGRLAPAAAARAQQNLDTFKSWLARERIPYETSSWVW